LVALLNFLVLICVSAKNTNVLPNALAVCFCIFGLMKVYTDTSVIGGCFDEEFKE